MKNIVNKALISTIVLATISTTGGLGTIETVLATDNTVKEDVQVVKETSEDTTLEQDTATLEQDTTVKEDIKEVTKEDNKVKETSKVATKEDTVVKNKEVKEIKAVEKKVVTDNNFAHKMTYKQTDTQDFLNYRSSDFTYFYNQNKGILKVKYKDYSEQEFYTFVSDEGELLADINYEFGELNSIQLGMVKVDMSTKSVESIATGYLHFSPKILENTELEPFSGVYTTDNFAHTILYKNINEEGQYVIQTYEDKDDIEYLKENEEGTLLTYQNREDAVFIKHNLRFIHKKEVTEQVGYEGKFDNTKEYADLTDDKLSLTPEDVQVVHNHFYPKIDGYTYINANDTTSSKLAYTFNERGDLTFKIDSILDTNNNFNQFKYTYELDETLKNSETYKQNIGQTRENSYKIFMSELQQTNEIRLKATFNEDNITVEIDRDSIMGVGKTTEIYALTMFIDNFEAPIVEEPKEPTKQVKPKKEEVKKEVVKPEVKKLPKAGNQVNTGLLATISTILATTTGLYIFKRR